MITIQNMMLVGIGGFIGSLARYLTSTWVQSMVKQPWLPYGTLAVNVLGCFLIGLLSGLAEFRQLLKPEMRLLVLVGILGGFTTFSTFGIETFALARDREIAATLANIAAQVVIGLFAVWGGHVVARFV